MTPADAGPSNRADPHASGLARPALALALAVFTGAASMRSLDALLPNIAHEFGRSVGSAGAATSAYALSYSLFQLVYGPLGDRLGAYRVVMWATGLSAVAAASCSLATSLEELIALRFVAGAIAAAIGPLTLAWVSGSVRPDHRSLALARIAAVAILGGAAGQVGGGVLGGAFGERTVFVSTGLMFGISALAMTLIARRLPGIARPEQRTGSIAKPHRQLLCVFARPRVRWVLAGVGIECFGVYLTLAYAGTLLRERLALDPARAGLIVGLFGAGGLVFVASASSLLRHAASGPRALAGGALMCVAFAALGMSHSVLAAGASLFAVGFGFLLLHNVLQTAAATVAPDAVATCVSLFAATATLAQAVGAAFGGVLVDRVGSASVCLVSATVLACLAVALGWRGYAEAKW